MGKIKISIVSIAVLSMLFAQGCKIPYVNNGILFRGTLPETASKQLLVEKTLKLADFDGGDMNEFGGDMETWGRDAEDKTCGCSYAFDGEVKRGKSGASLRLEYDVSSLNPAYNGFRTKLEGRDISDYEAIVFWVKGDKEKGYADRFKMELKNVEGETGRFLVTGVTDEWKEITIPFADFKGTTNFRDMSELDIIFNDVLPSAKEGVVYIDDITFISYYEESSAPL